MSWYKTAQVKQPTILLWLDDLRPMPQPFNLHVKTASEAINVLQNNNGNIKDISLDHDLGEGNGDGYQVAQWIEQGAFNGTLDLIPHMTSHSANPIGRQRIMTALHNARRYWEEKR
jgi:hypothetical protein